MLITAAPVDPAIARAQRAGVRVTLLPFAREDALAGHKLLHYVPAILGRIAARRRGAFEALYVDRETRLSEGTTSNLFIYRRGRLLTPPLQRTVLPGVTRRLVIDLARSADLQVHERALRVTDLSEANEAFCTSSLIEIVPIVRVAKAIVGTGKPGPITRRLQQDYRDAVGRGAEPPL